MKFTSVIIHPIVLLTVLDHYKRVARNSNIRVFGVLLGSNHNGEVDVTNCFAVPYEESMSDPTIWFFDYVYAEEMAGMFKKVNSNEKVIGFYSSGPEIRISDLDLEEQFRKLVDPSIYAIVDTRISVKDIPAKCYYVEETINNGKISKTFRNLPTKIGASPVEEVGVEHLLRDVNDPLLSNLSNTIQSKIRSLLTMESRLNLILEYLDSIVKGKCQGNLKILGNIQEILNCLPELILDKMESSLYDKTNDIHLVLLVSNILRSLTSLYDVINNHLEFINA